MSNGDPTVFTPYSTIVSLVPDDNLELYIPQLDRDRIFAYQKYEEIYWGHTEAFKLAERGDEDDQPIYVPNAMTIVDTTSHFFLKGLKISSPDEKLAKALDDFIKREEVYSRFHVAKHSGVTRGDFILHLTANPNKPAGSRLSLNSVDPAIYFPETDDDDLDKITAVNLAETIAHPLDPTKSVMHVLRYDYANDDDDNVGTRRVFVQEATFEIADWWDEGKRTKVSQVSERRPLPERITQIPVYHFKNREWQGWPFGASELKGYETLLQAIAQGATDEQMALSLEGLGVYATSSGPPTDADGREMNWVIAPGYVMELNSPQDTFRRVEGIATVKPFQEHFKFLTDSMYEAAATFRGGSIDATIAESGIALAIRFLPTAAKLEQRDTAGVGKLHQLFFDWKNWAFVYEDQNFGEADIQITIGDKLPTDKADILNTLNNMADRKIIPKKWYREQVAELYGFEFPEDIEAMLQAEADAAFEEAKKRAELGASDDEGDNSNNKNNRNESGGTEQTQSVDKQTKPERK